MAESLNKNPFVDRIDGQKDDGLGVQSDVSNGFSGSPGWEIVL